MNRIKCKPCGLINLGADENCRRCGINLHSDENAPPRYVPDYPSPAVPDSASVTFGRILIVIIVFGFLGFAAYYVKVMRPEHIAAEKKQAEEDDSFRKSQMKNMEREQNEIRQRETRDAMMRMERDRIMNERR
jgi:uncharacterized protein HemX